MFAQLKGLFTPQAVVQHLKALPDVKSSIMDILFPDRPTKPFAVVGIEEIASIAGAIPVVTRGGMSTPLGQDGMGFDFIEPLPVKPSVNITGQDLNNLRMILGNRASLDVWSREKLDYLRKTCRATTEGIAATALTGKIQWPVKTDAGFETYSVDYGKPLSVTPTKKLDTDDASLRDLYELLSDMETEIQDAGVAGGDIEYMAGKKAFGYVLSIAESLKSTAKHNIRIDIKNGAVVVGGYLVRKMSERYRNPQTGKMVPKIPDHKILGYATDASGKIIYCALDDLDAKLQPLPFFPKVVKLPEGNGLKLIGQSKPLPVRSPKSLCWADAVSV